MLPPDLANQLRLITESTVQGVRPTTPVPGQLPDRLPELIPGDRVSARIDAPLGNGLYRAMINQTQITLALPFAVKAGDSLELEVVAHNAKGPTFAVVATPGQPPLPAGAGQTSASLSPTGQLIAQLFSGGKPTVSGQILNGGQPLLPQQALSQAGGSLASLLAPVLKAAIGHSGLFHESHLAQWASGQRPLIALMAEPQQSQRPATAQAASGPLAGGRAAAAPAPLVAAGLAAQSAAEGGTPAPLPSGAEARPTALAPHTSAIVHQQLEALANQTYVFRGDLSPGVSFRWEVEDGEAGRGEQEKDAPPHWRTRLAVDLPDLGEIDASLTLTRKTVSLTLNAPATQLPRLLAHRQELFQILTNSGLSVERFELQPHRVREG